MKLDPAGTKLESEWKVGSPLMACRFDPSGRFLFAAAQDNTVRRLDLLTGSEVTFAGHASWVRGIAFISHASPHPSAVAAFERAQVRAAAVGGAAAVRAALPPVEPAPFTVVTADYHGKLLWWRGDAPEPKALRTVEAHDGWVRAVAASPDGSVVATCGNDHKVRVWGAADGWPLRTLEGHECHVYNVAFHPDGQRLASADLKGNVKDWDWRAGVCTRTLDAKPLYKYDTGFMADIGGARGMAFDPAGKRLVCCGITNVSNAFAGVGNPMVVAIDWADGKAKQLTPKDAFQGTAWGVAVHPTGCVIAAGSGSGGQAWFWPGPDGPSAHVIGLPAGGRDLALSPGGGRFAVAGANGVAYVYSLDVRS